MTARILIIDDDSITQGLLKGVLKAHGYVVDTANDGFAAVKMVQENHYDLAMIDYQMPDLDGYSSAKVLRNVSRGDQGPKLVAVTGFSQSLEAREGADGVFDAIFPKDMEPQRLFRSIEQLLHDPKRAHAIEAATEVWRLRGLAGRPKVLPVPAPRLEQILAIETCFEAAEPGQADMVGLLQRQSDDMLYDWRAGAADYLLPIVDLTGVGAPGCDATFNMQDPQSWTQLAAVIGRFAARRGQLTPAVRQAADLDTRLLAYIYVSDQALQPMTDLQSKLFVQYPGFFRPLDLHGAADRLTKRGLLRQTFVDRYHACPSCRSHRMNVREECLTCRSPHLQEVALIHHFRCAEIGHEDAFRSGTALVCPKCRQHLRHYGTDYDKPGTTLLCMACETSNSEPAIGFSCQDCGAHTDGDAAPTCDVHTYALTEMAVKRLTGPGLLIEGPRSPRPADLDAELIRLAGEQGESTAAMACIAYARRDAVIRRRGEPAFVKLRALFVDNIRNVIAEIGGIIAEGDMDYLVLRHTEQREMLRLWPSLMARCEATLAESLGPTLSPFGVFSAAAA